jgi:glutathione S-transferase
MHVPKLKLVIANKNYSSWSMRAWVLLTHAGIPFTEVQLKFADDGTVRGIEGLSPSGLVPALWIDDEVVWDSLAICETVAELFADKQLWPADPAARRVARCVSAEMHAGFRELRKHMVMNIRSSHPGKGRTPQVAQDIARVVSIWEGCRSRFGAAGPFLFGSFTCADAMFAPVATRFRTYAVSLPPVAQRYADTILALPAVEQWCVAGRAETEFVAADEPYATRV